jgi:molybdopterin converting factor small subunit
MPHLIIPTALRAFTERQSAVEVAGSTVREAVDALVTTYPDLKPHLYDEAGVLRSFVNVFVGDTNIKETGGLDTPVAADTNVLLIPAIAGGSDGAR